MEHNFKHNLHSTEGNTVSKPQSPISPPSNFQLGQSGITPKWLHLSKRFQKGGWASGLTDSGSVVSVHYVLRWVHYVAPDKQVNYF